MNDEFIEWAESNTVEIRHVTMLLKKNMSDEPGTLIHDLIEIEAWYARTGYLLAEASSWLDKAKMVSIPSKQGMTEFERKIKLDGKIADVRAWRDKIESIHDAIKTRITLGQSLLAYKRQSIENSKTLRTAGAPF